MTKAAASTRVRRVAALVFLAAGQMLLALPAPSAAQDVEELRRQAERILGRPLTDEEIIRRLRQSGLTPDEIRSRLEARGFDPSAADAYLRVLEGETGDVPLGTDPLPLVDVLVGADVGDEMRPLGRVPSGRPETTETPDPLREEGPPIFGRELFRRATSMFEPVTTGPVPVDYRLGPGDQVILVLTGDVEQAYELTVTREGWIVIPDVGRVFVNGLAMEQLEEALYNRLGEVYSGISRGAEATTFFDISVGELRSNQVYVVGEVEEPAAYQVSSLATALTALYYAGGPNDNGSFRNVMVNRGGEAVAHLDLYDYLLGGDAREDVRLEQGDILFVPPVERRASIDGAVLRPALYELEEGETLRTLIRFAGGLQPNADLRRVQIERILPPEERGPGRDRAFIDVSLADLDEAAAVPTRAGDRVTVFAVLDDLANWVTVSGGVWRPGTYAAESGTRLWDVIRRAGGLLPDVYEGRAQIQRLEEADYTRRMIPVTLGRGPDGEPLENPEIRAMDQVFVYSKRNLREDRVVSIGGWVQEPGVYPYVDGMTIRDLILRAGGVRTGAFLGHAEVSRLVISQSHQDTLTNRFLVPLDSSYVVGSPSGGAARGASGGGEGSAADGAPGGGASAADGAAGSAAGRAAEGGFTLESLDAVYVRKSPGFEPQKNIVLTGEVMLPGPYSLQTRSERLTDLIARAGGLTPEAYPEGLQLWRPEPEEEGDTLTTAEIAGRGLALDSMTLLGADPLAQDTAAPVDSPEPIREEVRRTRVGVDFLQAMRRPDGTHNILVEPNDSIHVPRYIPTVEVRGAVGLPTKVLYRRGADLGYYIDQAGGYAEDADKGRTRVRYANGEVRTRGGKFLFFGGGVPEPDPGASIFVPDKPEREGGMRLTELVGIMTSVMTATATIIIATQ